MPPLMVTPCQVSDHLMGGSAFIGFIESGCGSKFTLGIKVFDLELPPSIFQLPWVIEPGADSLRSVPHPQPFLET